MQASEEARLPFVLLGSVTSGKNFTAAALLGAQFTWVPGSATSPRQHLILSKEEKQSLEEDYGETVFDVTPNALTSTRESTVLYDHRDLACPFYNMRGFGKSGFSSVFQSDVNTPATHASLQKIIKGPMKGFVLTVDRLHLNARREAPSLDVMDFLLPYCKDAAAVTKYLGPSVCLVITGCGTGRSKRGDWVTKQEFTAIRLLRQSMRTCYTKFYKAKQGTEAYATLAKQKAFYDIFIKNSAYLTSRKDDGFRLQDFELDMDKVICFDPRTVIAHHIQADVGVIRKAVDKFQGIEPAALVRDDKGTSYWLWAVPAVGAAAYAWSSSQDSAEDENKRKPRGGQVGASVTDDDDDDTDDDDMDDAMPKVWDPMPASPRFENANTSF